MDRAGKAWLMAVAVMAVGTGLALPAGASARPRPAVSFSLARGSEGAPISFTWSARRVGGARLVVQRPVGTAHTWKTMLKLSGTSGSGQLPGVALGTYQYRLAALNGGRVLAQAVARAAVFGQVPFTTLFGPAETATFPTFTFPYVTYWEGQFNRSDPTIFQVEHNHCISVHIAFVPGATESSASINAGSGSIVLVQESHEAVAASASYGTPGSLDTSLTPGQSWGVNAGSEENIHLNGYAVCDSTESFFGS